ncbi:MAG: hypothetical protein Q4A28_05335 [Brachymonas sp.]|nr:hypothetical protein [Brachymonas sp.]
MALILCPECKRRISDQALACPHCGLPQPLSSRKEAVESAHEPFLQSKTAQTAVKGLTAWALLPWVGKIIVAIAALAFLAYFFSSR